MLIERLAHHPRAKIDNAFQEIGRLVATASDMDAAITVLLGAITDTSADLRETILHCIDFNRKCELVTALVKGRADLSELRKTVDRAKVLMERRNYVAHAALFTDNDDLILVSVALPKLLKQGQKFIRVSELATLSDRMEAVSAYCFDYVKRVEQHRALAAASSTT